MAEKQVYIPPHKRSQREQDTPQTPEQETLPAPDHDIAKDPLTDSSYYYTRSSEFNQVIRHLIDLFKHQRRRKFQFSVLYLSPHEHISTETLSFQTRKGEVTTPKEATDRDSKIFPQGGMSFNYLTARPDGEDHAEALIMARFDSFMRSYMQRGMPCKTILLFTWILPCDSCKDCILQHLNKHLKQVKVVLVYVTGGEKDEDSEKDTIHELESAGITVNKIHRYNIQEAQERWR